MGLIHTVIIIGIIEYHEGCNVRPEGCMGPWDNFYTLFGSELRFLTGHIVVSIIIGFIADALSPATAILLAQLAMAPVVIIYWKLFKNHNTLQS